MEIIKHPIVVSLAFGTTAFVVASYLNPVIENKQKKNKNVCYFNKQKEINVAIGVVVCIITWCIVRNIMTNDVARNKSNLLQTNIINSVSSDDTNISFDTLGTGIKIPTKELPPVFIDYR